MGKKINTRQVLQPPAHSGLYGFFAALAVARAAGGSHHTYKKDGEDNISGNSFHEIGTIKIRKIFERSLTPCLPVFFLNSGVIEHLEAHIGLADQFAVLFPVTHPYLV